MTSKKNQLHEARIALPSHILLLEEEIAKAVGVSIGERLRAIAIERSRQDISADNSTSPHPPHPKKPAA